MVSNLEFGMDGRGAPPDRGGIISLPLQSGTRISPPVSLVIMEHQQNPGSDEFH